MEPTSMFRPFAFGLLLIVGAMVVLALLEVIQPGRGSSGARQTESAQESSP